MLTLKLDCLLHHDGRRQTFCFQRAAFAHAEAASVKDLRVGLRVLSGSSTMTVGFGMQA